jgi:amino acid adenylation domain-containing protein
MKVTEEILFQQLHSSQLEVYYDQLLDPESPHYNVGGYVILTGKLNQEKLLAAIKSTFQSLDIHQMAFEFSKSAPLCYFKDNAADIKVLEIDFTKLDDPDKAVLDWMQERYNTPFYMEADILYEFAVIRLADEKNIIYCRYHHLLTDAFGFTIGLKSVAQKYNSLVENQDKVPLHYNQYKDELAEDHNYLASDRYQKDRNYWLTRFKTIPEPILPKKNITGANEKNKTLIFNLSDKRREYYTELFQSTGISIQQLTILALHIYYGSIAENKECTFGVEVYKRRKQQWNTAGMFAGILPFKVSYQQQETVFDLAMKIRKQLLTDYRHQHYPISHLNRELKLFRENREQLFEIYVNYLLLDFDLKFSELECNTYELLSEFEKNPLRFWWRDYGKQQGLQLRIDYNTAYLTELEAPQLIERILDIMDRLGHKMHSPISEVKIITEDEERQIMTKSKGPAIDLPKNKTFINIFEEQVINNPKQIAVVCQDQSLTYKELDEQSDRLANFLKLKGVEKETIVGVCLERSIDSLVCILAIWKAAATYLPVDPDYPSGRINCILENSGAKFLLANSNRAPASSSSANCNLVFLDEYKDQIQNQPNKKAGGYTQPDNLAYIIYTSGSTGEPKGVMIEHKGMLNHLFAKANDLSLNNESKVLQNASASFDISIWQFVSALLKGGTTVIYSQDTILNTGNFLSGIAKDKLTHVEVVPSYLRALLEDQNHTDLELSQLKYLLVTGEALPKHIVAAWLKRFPKIEMINAYGPTEASDDITHYHMNVLPNFDQVPIGFPVQNMDVYVFTPNLKLCPAGVPGEIGVAGIGVGRGYINNHKLTSEKFIENPFSRNGHHKLYKTGDMGYWQPGGELSFIGRIDDQVKIRGHRIELGEIEATFVKYPGIQQAVVTACEDANGIKKLVAYLVPEGSFIKEGLQPFLKNSLPEYMVPSIIIELDAMPLTSNGKIDRKALPAADLSAALANEYLAPRNQLEEQLAEIWEKILDIKRVGIKDNFFELGGDSLHAARLVATIRKELLTEIVIKDLFAASTIAELSLTIAVKRGNVSQSEIKPAKRPDKIPLSFSQERLWFIDQLQGSLHYQVPILLKIKGNLNKSALENALNTVVNRHEALRTVFKEDDMGIPYQYVLPLDEWKLAYTDDFWGKTVDEIKSYMDASLAKPIVLAEDYMIRAELIRLEEEEYLLLIVMHHIASDGWSMPLYIDELRELYLSGASNRKASLKNLPIQYADYAIWQKTEMDGELLQRKLDFWEKQLAGIEPLCLPTDFSRPAVQSVKGNTLNFKIDKELHEKLKIVAKKEGVTMYMLMLTVFKVLLYRYTGQDDICVGSPVANRSHREIEPLIGFFVNTIALRDNLSGNPVFRDLLNQVKHTTLEAFSNQDVPFDKIVNRISKTKDMSRSPIFQVMFNLENNPDISNIELDNITISAQPILYELTKFELTYQVGETPDGLTVDIEYCTDLFTAATIGRMMQHFTKLLHASVINPSATIASMPMILPGEEQQLIFEFNNTYQDYPKDKTVAGLFRNVAIQNPDSIAIVFENQTMTYAELDKKSDAVADFLIKKGVEQNSLVAICIDRSFEMIIGLLAIMKAGCTYVPVDPSHPAERINYIIEDCGAYYVISNGSCNELLELDEKREVILIDRPLPVIKTGVSQKTNSVLQTGCKATEIVYVIYTSGSTGKPKGVMVKQQSLINFLFSMIDTLQFKPQSNLLAVTTYSFDISYLEIYMPLLTGGTVILASNESAVDGFLLKSLINTHQPAFMQATPATWQLLMDAGWTNEEKTVLLSGGEAISEGLKEYLVSLNDQKVWNLYGPTETTIWSTIEQLKAGEKITIGVPIANTQIYISNNIVSGSPITLAPIGVTGELLIGGEGLAKGYWKKPALTVEKFIANPFNPAASNLLYRTGDLARRLPDGRIECLGRTDSQVKIRGYRIELGEIESIMLLFHQIKKCAVLAKKDAGGQMNLVAYPVSDTSLNRDDLMAFMKSKLPVYMVPNIIVEMADLPLNPNGKIDRNALPDPNISELRTTQYVAPRNETEEILVAIWQGLLHVDQVGVYDNFFELGGHSLLATRVMASCRKEFEINIPLRILFDFNCIADLANYIRVIKINNEAEMEFEVMAL